MTVEREEALYKVSTIAPIVAASDQVDNIDAIEMDSSISGRKYPVEEERMEEFYQSMAPSSAYQYHRSTEQHKSVDQNLAPAAFLQAKVLANTRLTTDDWWQDVRHVKLCVEQSVPSREREYEMDQRCYDEPYKAGDVAVIMPQNDDQSVERFLSVLPASIRDMKDQMLKIEPLRNNGQEEIGATVWPSQCTLRTLLTKCMDINGRPEREFLRSFSLFMDRRHPQGVAQATKLIEMSEPSSGASALFKD